MTHLWPDLPRDKCERLSDLWRDWILWRCDQSHSNRLTWASWQGCWHTTDRRQWPCRMQADPPFLNGLPYLLQCVANHLAFKEATDPWDIRLWRWIRCYEAWDQNAEGTEIQTMDDGHTFDQPLVHLWGQKSQVTNSSRPESTLQKKCNSICYHAFKNWLQWENLSLCV